MQTFLPYKSFKDSFKVLDYRRLGKQRVEAYQILNVLLGRTKTKGWSNHPATESLPVAPIGDEFAWTVGFRSGWFGLSYEQLLMNGGAQHTVSFGLQR